MPGIERQRLGRADADRDREGDVRDRRDRRPDPIGDEQDHAADDEHDGDQPDLAELRPR